MSINVCVCVCVCVCKHMHTHKGDVDWLFGHLTTLNELLRFCGIKDNGGLSSDELEGHEEDCCALFLSTILAIIWRE
jgi:hypothetical protein